MTSAAYVKINGEYFSPGHSKAKALVKSVGGLATPKPEPDQVRALDRKSSALKRRKGSVVIICTFLTFVSRRVDSDNFGSGPIKPLRDAIAKSIGVDDGDSRLKFEYSEPIFTRGATGVQVLISRV